MFDRRILLALGVIALVAGVGLAGYWLRIPSNAPVQTVANAKSENQVVLVAARPLKERALLRQDDMGWRTLPAVDVGIGAYVRGSATPAELAGAVVRRALTPGEVLRAEDIVRPNEAGFLANVLGSGMRAVAIAVGPAEGAAGLIVPGDRVDVVLIQNFSDQDVQLGHRSVGETVLSNLRVIAIDQTIVPDSKARGADLRPGAPEGHIAKTVTLEVSPSQAEVLMVAIQLGKVQLTLRNASESGDAERRTGVTWSSDVSPALKELGRDPSGLAATNANTRSGSIGLKPGQSIEVLHGRQIELRCFNESGRVTTDCGTVAPMPQEAPAATTPSPPATRTPSQVPTPSTNLRTPPATSSNRNL